MHENNTTVFFRAALSLVAIALLAACGPATATTAGGSTGQESTDPAPTSIEQPAVDYGHEQFQPAYADGRIVHFEQRGPAAEDVDPDSVTMLYEVEYPTGWQALLARPLCNYCDHNGDGENAWDYHDHVLDDLPTRKANAAGDVHWQVMHVLPDYGDDEAINAEITNAYADLLPVQSGDDVRRLLDATLDDATAIATAIDTQYIFTAPLIRR